MVHQVIEMMQLIEDVWLSADLDRNWNHPQMIGWMNAFRRWTSSPIVCQWWPFLAPLFTPGMREFAETHLKVPAFSATRNARLETRIVLPPLPTIPTGRFELLLRFQVRVPGMAGWSEVATAEVTRFTSRNHVERPTLAWTAANFSVREGMAFPSLAAAFLRQVVDLFGRPPTRGAVPSATTVPDAWRVDDLEVRFSNDGSEFAPIRGRNRRELRHRAILFYKANRFAEDPSRSNESSTYLVRRLG